MARFMAAGFLEICGARQN